MTSERPLLPHETALIASGAYQWLADSKPLPITEHWRILRAASGYLFSTETDALAVAEFGHRYTAALSIDASGRATALAMSVTKGADTMEISANLERDAVAITRVLSSKAEGAVQRTQTFRMEPGYTIEAHPVLFDGLHIAAIDRAASGPHRRPCLWLDLLTHDLNGLMAARPTVYVINRRSSGSRETFAITRWGNDVEMAESLITIKDVGRWVVPTEFRFTMAGVLYAVRLADEQWEE
ncbi:MAG TPA: hypothetical protein VIG44_05125 [Thermomicrobiales bacterium]|jgi:hypothetical protein